MFCHSEKICLEAFKPSPDSDCDGANEDLAKQVRGRTVTYTRRLGTEAQHARGSGSAAAQDQKAAEG